MRSPVFIQHNPKIRTSNNTLIALLTSQCFLLVNVFKSPNEMIISLEYARIYIGSQINYIRRRT